MKRGLLLLIVLLSFQLTAQTVAQHMPWRNAIRLRPVKLAFREVGFGYEFRMNDHTGMELIPGFVYPNKDLNWFYSFFANSNNMKFRGVSLLWQTRFYTPGKKENGIRNLHFVVGYRYLWYTDETMSWHNIFGNSTREIYLSQWRSDLILMVGGGRALFGQKIIHEFNMQAGFRISYLHTHIIGCSMCQGNNLPYGVTEEQMKNDIRESLNPQDGFPGMLLLNLSYQIGITRQ